MEGLEKQCFQIISAVGMARSSYIEAIQEAKKANFERAREMIEEGDKSFLQGHEAHAKMIQQEAGGKKVETGLLCLLYTSSTAAFRDMYYHLTANVSVECLGQTMTLTQVKNLCHSTSRDVRKEAFLCEMKAYESIKEPLAFSINNIKRQQLMEARMRGYEDPLDKMLQDSFMKKGTLNTMYVAVDKYLPRSVSYTHLDVYKRQAVYSRNQAWYVFVSVCLECCSRQDN